MNNAGNEIYAIQGELREIVNELNSIANDLNTKFKGIGSERCAEKLFDVARNYNYVIQLLYQVDYNKIVEENNG